MQKVVLFDFDGTIADSLDGMIHIINELAKKYNFKPVAEDEIESLRNETVSAMFKRLKVPLFKLPLLAIDTKALQQKQIASIKPINGMQQALQDLQSAGYTLGILTSNGKENVHEFLKNNNLDVFTYFSFDSSLFGKDKMLKRFMKKHGLTPEQIVYVGDEIRDIEASIRAGIEMVAVTWGFNSKEALMKYQPNTVVEKPSQLLTAIKSTKATSVK
jgi:HAD superfamily hydrolase (TIGR01549 family)